MDWKVKRCAKQCRTTGEKRKPKVKFRTKFKHEHHLRAVRDDHRSIRWHFSSGHWHSDVYLRHSSMWHTPMLSNDRKWNASHQNCLGARSHCNWTHLPANPCHTHQASIHYKFQMSNPMERPPSTINSQIYVTPYDRRCARIIERQCQVCRQCPDDIHDPVWILRRHFSKKCFVLIWTIRIDHVAIMNHYRHLDRRKFS